MGLALASTLKAIEVLSDSMLQIPELISHRSGLSFNIVLLFCALQKVKLKQKKKNMTFILRLLSYIIIYLEPKFGCLGVNLFAMELCCKIAKKSTNCQLVKKN